MVLLVYTILMVFVGRFEAYTPYITKGLTPLFVLVTILFFRNPIAKFPKEYFVYIALIIWAFLSVIKIDNFGNFQRYMQLFLGITMLGTIACVLLPRYNIFNYFHIGFFLGATLLLYDSYVNYNLEQIILQEAGAVRLEGETGAANTIAAIFLLGSLSLIFVFDSTKNIILKFCTVILFLALVIGIITTASRSSTLCVIIAISLYIIGKLYLNKHYIILLGTAFLLFISISAGYDFIMENTFMGHRIEKLQAGQDGSGNERKELIFEGLDMIKKNPFLGVGLGNFSNNSVSGNYSHNDFIEVTSTIGIPGLCIYLLFFILFEIKLINLQKKGLSKNDKGRLMVIQLSLFIYFINGFFKPLFIDLFFMFYIGMLLAETQRLKIHYARLSNN